MRVDEYPEQTFRPFAPAPFCALAVLAALVCVSVSRPAIGEEAEPEVSAEDGRPTAPRAVDVIPMGVGSSSKGLALRFGGGATPWAVGPVAIGGRIMFGADGSVRVFGPHTSRGSVALYPRAAVDADLGWSRFELGMGIGVALWRERTKLEDGETETEKGASPVGELGGAWLFGGRKADIGLELRGEAIGLDSFGVVLGIRVGGRLP